MPAEPTDLTQAAEALQDAHTDAAYVLYVHAPLIVTLLRGTGMGSAQEAAEEVVQAVARWREASEQLHSLVREQVRQIRRKAQAP